jgi:hypothetical protein
VFEHLTYVKTRELNVRKKNMLTIQYFEFNLSDPRNYRQYEMQAHVLTEQQFLFTKCKLYVLWLLPAGRVPVPLMIFLAVLHECRNGSSS